jgi:rhodanese-related sulfurtransferase
VLDVRSIGEYGFAHIPGTRWLPRGRLELDIAQVAPDRATPLALICDDAVRSTLAAGTLRQLGYGDVRVLRGGTREWEGGGRALEDGLEGTGVSTEDAQADFGHSVWHGALGKSREDMERYLSWEIDLVKDEEAAS